jgi:hypothetical protein
MRRYIMELALRERMFVLEDGGWACMIFLATSLARTSLIVSNGIP